MGLGFNQLFSMVVMMFIDSVSILNNQDIDYH